MDYKNCPRRITQRIENAIATIQIASDMLRIIINDTDVNSETEKWKLPDGAYYYLGCRVNELDGVRSSLKKHLSENEGELKEVDKKLTGS